MSLMILGGYTFPQNPASVSTLMTEERITAAVKTYGGVAFFSWGSTMIGKTISLHWGYMTMTQYAALRTLLLADASVLFTPQDGSGKGYQVEIIGLTGTYFLKLDQEFRQQVVLDLLILSEAI